MRWTKPYRDGGEWLYDVTWLEYEKSGRGELVDAVKAPSSLKDIFAASGYALDSRRPHTLWSATAATAPSRGHRAAVVDPIAAAHCAPRGRQRLTLKPEGEALLKLPSVRE